MLGRKYDFLESPETYQKVFFECRSREAFLGQIGSHSETAAGPSHPRVEGFDGRRFICLVNYACSGPERTLT